MSSADFQGRDPARRNLRRCRESADGRESGLLSALNPRARFDPIAPRGPGPGAEGKPNDLVQRIEPRPGLAQQRGPGAGVAGSGAVRRVHTPPPAGGVLESSTLSKDLWSLSPLTGRGLHEGGAAGGVRSRPWLDEPTKAGTRIHDRTSESVDASGSPQQVRNRCKSA